MEFDRNEIEQSLDELVKGLSDLLPKLFGRELSPEAAAVLPQLVYGKVDELLLLQKKTKGMSLQALTKDNAVQLSELIDIAVRLAVDDMPDNMSGLDWVLAHLQEQVSPISGISYLSDTSYLEYRDLLFDLAHTVCQYSVQQSDYLTGFLNDIDQDLDTSVAMGQMLFTELDKDSKFLEKELKNATAVTMRRYARIYGDLSGYFEKSIRFIAGLIDILDGTMPDYKTIRGMTLAKNLRRVRRSSYAGISGEFDSTIRNAIAHKSDYFDPVKQTVEFPDLTQARSIPCQAFVRQTRELSALVLALAQSRLILSYAQLSLFKQTLEQLKADP